MVEPLDITKRYHERLLETANRAATLVDVSLEGSDLIGLEHLRREMVFLLEGYAAYVIQMPLVAQDVDKLHYIEQLRFGAIILQRSYEKFRTRWVHREATENWHEYRLSLNVMIKQLCDHIRTSESMHASFRKRAQSLPLFRGKWSFS